MRVIARKSEGHPSRWDASERAARIQQPKRALAASMSSAMTRTMRSLVKFLLIGKPSRSIAAINLFGEHALHPPEEVS